MSNEDDDLFADLYGDDEPEAAKPAPAVPAPLPIAAQVDLPAAPILDVATQLNAAVKASDPRRPPEEAPQAQAPMPAMPQMPQMPTMPQMPPQPSYNTKEDGKMFIGGLNWETTDDSLRAYFEQFGPIADCMVMRDGATGRSRGFGFLTFTDSQSVNVVMQKEHFLDGKIIDPKRAVPRDEQEKTAKMFVGGVPPDCSEEQFSEFFGQFGRVVDATLMMDKDTGRPRGFGFVTFDNGEAVEKAMQTPFLQINNKTIEVKRATPKGNQERGAGRGAAATYNPNGGFDQTNPAAAYGGMTPAMMAQYYQRMQQWMAQMQAMGRGQMAQGMMNPMMQQMQAQQAAQQQMQQPQYQQSQSPPPEDDRGDAPPDAPSGPSSFRRGGSGGGGNGSRDSRRYDRPPPRGPRGRGGYRGGGSRFDPYSR